MRLMVFERILYNGKELIETGHFKEELYYKYRKNLDLVEDILESGTHRKESKNRMIVTMPTKDGAWELVYGETTDELILIHIKLRRR